MTNTPWVLLEAYDDGDPATGNADRDRTTEYTYNADGQVKTMTARMSSTNYQTTEYVYGVTTSSSDLNSLALLASVKYPDPSTGAASGASGTVESFTYDRTGKRKKYTDRNGSVHEYTFDKLGRLTADAVTTLATGVNGDVRRLVYAYDVKGRLDTASSYDAATGGTLKNQVKRTYNDLGQLFKEYQAHSGAVNTGTTPFVGYAYSEMPSGANHSRPTSMTYPNGRILRYEYSSGADAELNRLSFLADDSSGSVGTHLEDYTYLGASTPVNRAHPEPGVDLTYIKQSGESATDGGDDYTGIDRFGRVIDQRWIKPSGGTHVDRFKYGYDRGSNRLFKENTVSTANSELYHANGASSGYDTLNRLIDFRRGTLSDTNSDSVPDTVSTASKTQGWTLDALGNWSSLNTGGTSVNRTHDKQNHLTAIGTSAALTYDNNGNFSVDPTLTRKNTYDAWNRLQRVGSTHGGALGSFPSYAYDALGRRIARVVSGEETADYYHSSAWQVVAEHRTITTIVVGGPGPATSYSNATFVWSPVYVDAIVSRDRDADENTSTGSLGFTGSGAEERLYAQADANFNVTSLVTAAGATVQRHLYDPYGTPTLLDGNWAAGSFATYQWRLLHQGGQYDIFSGYYHFRFRDYSPTLGRWVQQDPLSYITGSNLVEYVVSSPINAMDPTGLVREIRLCIGHDDSIELSEDPRTLNYGWLHDKKHGQLSVFKQIIDKCCRKFKKACDVNIKAHIERTGAQRKSPEGDVWQIGRDEKILAEALRHWKGTIEELDGCFFILVTAKGIRMKDGGNAVGFNLPEGIIATFFLSETGFAHECGHAAGYRVGCVANGSNHSGEKTNVMSDSSGGDEPDECYCEKMEKRVRLSK